MRGRGDGRIAADRNAGSGRSTRRNWLGWGTLGLILGPTAELIAQTTRKTAPLSADDEKAVAAAREAARKAGLGTFDVKSSEHFLGVGDGRPDYCSGALKYGEDIARDFLAHFRHLGFKVAFPAHRLVIVPLKDARSYKAFSGDEAVDETVGGHYDPDSNWLVIFDFRAGKGRTNAEAKRINTFTLVHETVHLLCYNTGLQTAEGDVPAGISEGLATYGELWTRAHGAAAFGMVNKLRIQALTQFLDGGLKWIPMSRFLTDDNLFLNPPNEETAQLAYGEAWVLVHLLLDVPEWRPKFRAYLAGVPKIGAQPGLGREKYAAGKLGPLDDLDRAVRRHAQHMARKK